ncbi:MAG: hypothetical protein JWL92_42 [Candidatus Nomurabacteria bacterium]|nr:hypothetical protein [Candidatus Nomurabacteria bacterium]
MNKKILALPTLALLLTIGISATVSAESVSGNVNADIKTGIINGKVDTDLNVRGVSDNHRQNGIFGTVTAINGNTITVSSKSMDKKATTQVTTTYSVNASGAMVDKNNVAATISTIAVGDNIFVEGKVDGTNVTAVRIHDGVMAKGNGEGKVTIPEGNGQPIIGGTVTAVNGNTITITNKSNISYTIDATSAKITKSGTTATVSNIVVGDSLVAQGTINGSSVTAVNIVDSGAMKGSAEAKAGLFGRIGTFFARIFGFGK